MMPKFAYTVGYRLGLAKRAKMGCAADPPKSEPSALIPRRYGMRSNRRAANFGRTDRITRPAMKNEA